MKILVHRHMVLKNGCGFFSLFIFHYFHFLPDVRTKSSENGKTVQTTVRYETKTLIGQISWVRDGARFLEIQNGGHVVLKVCEIQFHD